MLKKSSMILCLALILVFVMAVSLIGNAKEIELRFLSLQVGVHSEASWFTETIEKFNTEYKGKIKIVVDGVAGDEACWAKLRTDAAVDSMPDLFMLKHDRSEFNVLAQSGRVLALNDYIKTDPYLKDMLNDSVALAAYTDKKGNILGIPYARAYVGIYYNTELFARAGISKFPTTWDDFFVACEKLKAANITPISMMTGENAWCSMLMLANMIGTTSGGIEWLTTDPADQKFNVPVFVNAIVKLQKVLSKYTTLDAVGAGYGVAANNFLQGNTAMIANGPWMIGSFSDPKSAPANFESKVSYALSPGDGVIAMENIAWGVGSKTKEKQDAAVEFLKFLMRQDVYAAFLSVGGAAPCFKVDMSEVSYPRINKEFMPKAVEAKYKYSIVPNAVKPAIINIMPQYLPGIADFSMTPEEFIKKLEETHKAN